MREGRCVPDARGLVCLACERLGKHLEPAEPIEVLIDRSSLGAPEAAALRVGAPKAVVDAVLARVSEIEKKTEGG
jgi:hypothetical protein